MRIQVDVHYKSQSFFPSGGNAEAIRRVLAGHFLVGGEPIRPEDVSVFFSKADWNSDSMPVGIHFVINLLVDHRVRRSEDLLGQIKKDLAAVFPAFSEQHFLITVSKSEMF